MIKICFISTIPLTMNAFILRTAEYIYKNTDWQIYVICDHDDEFAHNLPKYITYYPIKMKRGISIGGINSVKKMYHIFRKEKFDLIQYSTPNASLYASIAGTLARVPVRLYCQWGMVFVAFDGIKRLLFKLEEKIVCSLSTWIEPDSKSNLEFAHNEGLYPRTKGSVIWNGSACGIDTVKFDVRKKQYYRQIVKQEYNLSEDSFVFGFVGRITRDKGVNELLAAFKVIQEQNSNAYLLMVGSVEKNSSVDVSLLDWAVKCPNVIFTGYTAIVEKYLSALDVYILPSYREGFGMGVIEAEAMGVPVIVTDIPGPRDAMVPSKTGLLIEKKNTQAVLDAMQEIMKDDTVVKMYGENAYSFAIDNFEQMEFFSRLLKDRKMLLSKTM